MDEHRGQAGLDDVPAEHPQHRASSRGGLRHRVRDREEAAGFEDVGQRLEEGVEGAVAPGRPRELAGDDLVLSAGERDGTDA